MAEKIIRLPQLQRFKTNADAKYQDKLTAGANITITGSTISATDTTYTAGTGISISNGVISVSYPNADIESF